MTLGEKLTLIRKKLNFSQREVARRSGLTQATISRCENNLTLQLKSDALRRLAAALSTSVDYLVGKEDLMKPEDVLKSDPSVREFVELYSELSVENRLSVVGWMKYLVYSSNQETA